MPQLLLLQVSLRYATIASLGSEDQCLNISGSLYVLHLLLLSAGMLLLRTVQEPK